MSRVARGALAAPRRIGYHVRIAERYAIESVKPGALGDLRGRLAERYSGHEDPTFVGLDGGELYAEFEDAPGVDPPPFDLVRANRWVAVRDLIQGAYDGSRERLDDFKVVPPTLLK
jgi:hypothetical protein